MGMLGSAVLILVGVLAAAADLSRRYPGMKLWIDALSPFQGYLGMGSAVYGFFLTLKMVAYIGWIKAAPFVYLATVAAALCALALGVLLGLPTARLFLGGKLSEKQWGQVGALQARLEENRLTLGYAGIWLGGFALLLNIFA